MKTLLLIIALLLPLNAFAQIDWVSPLQLHSAPVSKSWVASTFLTMVFFPTGAYLVAKLSASSTVTSTGTVKTPTDVVWIEASDIPNALPVYKTKTVKVDLTSTEIKQIADKNPSKYPTVKAAVNSDNGVQDTTTGATYYLGEFLSDVTLNNVNHTGGYWLSSNRTGSLVINGRPAVYQDLVDPNNMSTYRELIYYMGEKVIAAVPVVNEKLSGSTSGGNLKSQYQSEIDAMAKDPEYVPHFSDDSTGLPWVPPVAALTPSEVGSEVSKSTSAASEQAASDARSSAAAATFAAAAAYTASGGNPSTGVGGSASLYADYLRTKTAEDALKAKQAAEDATKSGNDNITLPSPPGAYGDGSTADFSGRMDSFLSTMRGTAIFSVPSSLMGNIPSGGTSSMNVSFGRFGSTVFDFASFSSAIALIRILVLFSFSVACVKIITLKGGA